MDDIASRTAARFSRWEWRRSGGAGLQVLNIIGSVGSIIGLVIGAGGATTARDVFFAIIAAVGLGALWLGAWLYRKSFSRSRYAEAHFYGHHVIHFLRNELAQIEMQDLKGDLLQLRAQAAVQLVLDAVCRAFIVVTGSRCRACIKVLQEPSMFDGQAITREQMREFGEVRCFSRDSVSGAYMTREEDAPSKLNRNPRFADLFDDEKRRFYYCPDCSDRNKHHTDSDAKYPHGLPYHSEFVWPIRLPSSVYMHREGERPKQKLVGYLIVDCRRRKGFDPEIDFEIGALFADALYGFLSRCHIRYYGHQPQKEAGSPANGAGTVLEQV